jgi:hypothetical protein
VRVCVVWEKESERKDGQIHLVSNGPPCDTLVPVCLTCSARAHWFVGRWVPGYWLRDVKFCGLYDAVPDSRVLTIEAVLSVS